MLRLLCSLALLGLFFAAGCASRPPETPPPDPENVVSGVGLIVYLDLEGGFYGLVADDSARYDPLNLADAFKKDSLRVRFRAEKRTDVMTTRMWGQPVHLLDLQPVEGGKD